SYEHIIRGRIKSLLLKRVQAVTPSEVAAVEKGFDEFVDRWCKEADTHNVLLFEPRPGNRAPSLLKSYDDAEEHQAWPTLRSLRDVDAESALSMEGTRCPRPRAVAAGVRRTA